MTISRRHFLGGCTSLALLNGLQLSIAKSALASTKRKHTFIHILLRGGADGLNIVSPISGTPRINYESKRKKTEIPLKAITKGNNVYYPAIKLSNTWGLNPNASALKGLWDKKHLAIIHATGFPDDYGSTINAVAQKWVETGIDARLSSDELDGWATRHLALRTSGTDVFSAVDLTHFPSHSLSGFDHHASIWRLQLVRPISQNTWHKNFGPAFGEMLNAVYSGEASLDKAMGSATSMVSALEKIDFSQYKAPPGVMYPETTPTRPLGEDLKNLATLIRASHAGDIDHDIQMATLDVDFEGAECNEGIYGYGELGRKVKNLSDAVNAFCKEMAAANLSENYTIVIQSEFGRTLDENESSGTSPGSGVPMLVIGQAIKGGEFYGVAPSLRSSELYKGRDVAVTTDYRQPLYEILGKQFGVTASELADIFPGYTHTNDLGLLDGDIAVGITKGIIFSDSFE